MMSISPLVACGMVDDARPTWTTGTAEGMLMKLKEKACCDESLHVSSLLLFLSPMCRSALYVASWKCIRLETK